MTERVACFTAGCDICSKGIFVRKNYWGKRLYTCEHNKKRHTKVDARNCGQFRCNSDRNSILCENCRKGK